MVVWCRCRTLKIT